MNGFIGKFADKAVWLTLIAVFVTGMLTQKYVFQPKYGRDTTVVAVKPPPAQTTTNIPATVPPKIVYRDRLVIDSTALWESAWLQNEVATLNAQIDTLLAAKNAREKLDTLLAPHTAVTPFSFTLLEGRGLLEGTAEQAYVPLKQKFGLSLTPTKLMLPQITVTEERPWWTKPALFIGGMATTYFIEDENTTGALVAGGVSLFIILEF